MEILLAYGVDAAEKHSDVLYRTPDDRRVTRFLLQHGALANDTDGQRRTPFETAIWDGKTDMAGEMAKWVDEEEMMIIKEEDIYQPHRGKYNEIVEAVRKGREERKNILGEW